MSDDLDGNMDGINKNGYYYLSGSKTLAVFVLINSEMWWNFYICDVGYFLDWIAFKKFVCLCRSISMSSHVIARTFTRQGINFLRHSQMDGTVLAKGSGNLVFCSAIVMSIMGVGLSMFSLSRLQSSSSLKVSAFRWHINRSLFQSSLSLWNTCLQFWSLDHFGFWEIFE